MVQRTKSNHANSSIHQHICPKNCNARMITNMEIRGSVEQENRNNPMICPIPTTPNTSAIDASSIHRNIYDEGVQIFTHPIDTNLLTCNRTVLEASALFNLGVARSRMGCDKDAGLYFQRALNGMNNINHCDHLPKFMILHNIGLSSLRSENLIGALSAYSRALRDLFHIIESQDCKQTNDTAKASLDIFIAATFNCMGVVKYKIYCKRKVCLESDTVLFLDETLLDAEFLLTESLNRRAALAGDHLCHESATTLNNLARCKFERGEYTDALTMYNNAHKSRLNILGRDHPDVAATLFNIAQTNAALSNTTEAIAYYEQYISLSVPRLGANHPDIANVYLVLGNLHNDDNNKLCALRNFMKALIAYTNVSGTRADASVAIALNRVGNALFEEHRKDAALDIYRQELITERALYPPTDHRISVTILNIAQIHLSRHNFEEALPLYYEALVMNCASNGTFSEPVANIKTIIASILERQGSPSLAINQLTEALEIRKDVHGSEHALVSSTLNSIGLVHYQNGEFKSALDFFTKALDIRRECECSTRDLSAVLFNVARMQQVVGEYKTSILLYEEILYINNAALESKEHVEGGSSDELDSVSSYQSEIAIVLQQLGQIHQECENYSEALRVMEQAAQIYEENLQLIVRAPGFFRGLGDLYLDLGNVCKATEKYAIAMRFDEVYESVDLEEQGFGDFVIEKYYIADRIRRMYVCAAAA